MIAGRGYLVRVKIAGAHRPLFVHLQGRIVPRSGKGVDELTPETHRRGVDNTPVAHPAEDAGQKLRLPLTSVDRPRQQHGKHPLQRLGEPTVECAPFHLRRGVLEIRAQHVVLSPALAVSPR